MMRYWWLLRILLSFLLSVNGRMVVHGFAPSGSSGKALWASHGLSPIIPGESSSSSLHMAQVSQQEAQKGIDKVVQALRKDSAANQELGRLEKVTYVLGFGSPTPGSLAVRFNASFKKGGFGRSSIPLPFGLGQSNESEGRGQMVGQVKAAIDTKTGRVTSCSVFRDLGYGRAFNLKT